MYTDLAAASETVAAGGEGGRPQAPPFLFLTGLTQINLLVRLPWEDTAT